MPSHQKRKSNCLYGAKGDYYGTLENELVKEESPEKYFYEDNFINDQNIDIFKNKNYAIRARPL